MSLLKAMIGIHKRYIVIHGTHNLIYIIGHSSSHEKATFWSKLGKLNSFYKIYSRFASGEDLNSINQI